MVEYTVDAHGLGTISWTGHQIESLESGGVELHELCEVMLVELILAEVGLILKNAEVFDEGGSGAHCKLEIGLGKKSSGSFILEQSSEILFDVADTKVHGRPFSNGNATVVDDLLELCQLGILVLLTLVDLHKTFSHAKLDKKGLEVGIQVIIEELAHTEFSHTRIGEADAHTPCLGGLGGDLDSQDHGRRLDLAAEIVLDILEVSRRCLLDALPIHSARGALPDLYPLSQLEESFSEELAEDCHGHGDRRESGVVVSAELSHDRSCLVHLMQSRLGNLKASLGEEPIGSHHVLSLQ